MAKITATTRTHATTAEAYADVADVLAQDWSEDYTGGHIREIRDGSALAIAALWQSPGSVGRHLATLASTGTVGLTDLLDDIAATRAETGMVPEDMRALDCLATWAINHQPKRAVTT